MTGLGILGQRQQRARFQLQDGPLRLGIESADRLDLVAEQFDAHRVRRFGRKDIDDAAANGIFAHHLDGVPPLIPDAVQVRRQVFERNLFAHAQREGELLVELALLHAQQRRADRRDGDGRPPRSHAQQTQRAFFQNFGVGRQALEGKHVERGQELRAGLLPSADEQIEERIDRFSQRLGLLAAIGDD